MAHPWSIRYARPYKQRHLPEVPIKTGIKELDQHFPLLRGSTGLLIGAEDCGQEAFRHLAANCADIDVIIYAGVGISGRESAALYRTYAQERVPKTVLLTSPPDAKAGDALVHRGLTIASYYRDMGRNAMLVIDSLDTWLSAAGTTAGLTGQEIYEGGSPQCLAELFAPAGLVTCPGMEQRQGSLTILGVLPWEYELTPMQRIRSRLVSTVWRMEENQGFTSASFSRCAEEQGGQADV
jgi:V/A-type H+-transporting ATPase subunit A